MSDTPIKVDVDLTKPITVFIEKIACAVGVVYEPTRIKRKAKAESEATIIAAKADAKSMAIEKRAANRLLHEEARKQQNMEAILEKTVPQIETTADTANMDNDWIAHFFEQSRQTSDTEMQDIWARILAGEANRPGSYSKRTVNLLAELEKSDAELFGKLTNFVWNVGGRSNPLIFNPSDTIYEENGITFDALKHLESLGLISFDALSGYILSAEGTGGQFILSHNGHTYLAKIPEGQSNQLTIGKVMFTNLGSELLAISPPETVSGLEEYIAGQYKSAGKEIVRV